MKYDRMLLTMAVNCRGQKKNKKIHIIKSCTHQIFKSLPYIIIGTVVVGRSNVKDHSIAIAIANIDIRHTNKSFFVVCSISMLMNFYCNVYH